MSNYLIGDVGGTNARFLVVDAEGDTVWQGKLLAEHYSAFADAVAEAIGQAGVAIDSVLLALACPVDQDIISLTNNSPWTFSQAQLRRQFGWQHLWVINDFAAMAYALPVLATSQLRHLGGPQQGMVGQCKLVLGPGTGLGIAGLMPVDLESGKQRWQVIPTEGGHANFAPADVQEMAILQLLQRRVQPVTREEILSGRGLLNLYRAVAEVQGVAAPLDAPAEITDAALQGEPLALATLHRFCAILGSVAGDMALSLGARGGVYITGGIVPRFPDLLAASQFRAAFENKYRYQAYLADIPTYLIEADEPGLIGGRAALWQKLRLN